MLYKFNGKPLRMLGGSLHVWSPTPGLAGDIQYWTCNNCGYDQNPEGAGTCSECGYDRYWTPGYEEETWTCENCGHENSGSAGSCSECGYSRGYVPEPSQEYDWECPNCQLVNHFYDNDSSNHYCSECGYNEMNGFDTPPDSGEIPPEEPPVDPETEMDWYCQNCNEMNDRGSYVCWNCGYDRDGNPPME